VAYTSQQRQQFNNWMSSQRGGLGFTQDQFNSYKSDPTSFIKNSGWSPANGGTPPPPPPPPPAPAPAMQDPTPPPQQLAPTQTMQAPQPLRRPAVPVNDPNGDFGSVSEVRGDEVFVPDPYQMQTQGQFRFPEYNPDGSVNLQGMIERRQGLFRDSHGFTRDANGNLLGNVTQNGPDPNQIEVHSGGPRMQPTMRAPVDVLNGSRNADGITFEDLLRNPNIGQRTGGNSNTGVGSVGSAGSIGGTAFSPDDFMNMLRDENFIGDLSSRINPNVTVNTPNFDTRFNSIDSILGTGDRSITDRLGGLETGQRGLLTNLGTQITNNFEGLGGRFDSLGSQINSLNDLSASGVIDAIRGEGGFDPRLSQGDIQSALTGAQFNGQTLGNRLAGIDTGLGGINDRFSAQGDLLRQLQTGVDTGLGGIRGILNDATFGLERLQGDLSTLQSDFGGFGDVVNQQLGARFGDAGTPLNVGFGIQDIQNAVGSRQSIGDVLAGLRGGQDDISFNENVNTPSMFSTLEQRLNNVLQDDQFKATSELELADLQEQQNRSKDQQLEELNRLGILGDGDTANVLGQLGESQNRERLQLQGNQEARRDRAIEQALGLGNLQSGFNLGEGGLDLDAQVQGGRQTLDQMLGIGDLGVREKEADSRNKQLEAQLQLARDQFNQAKSDSDRSFWSDIIGRVARTAVGYVTGGPAGAVAANTSKG